MNYLGVSETTMMSPNSNPEARTQILRSIRAHLAQSLPHDKAEASEHKATTLSAIVPQENGESLSLVETFMKSVEAVNGHCVIARDELDVVRALTKIISELQSTNLKARRIALSDSPMLQRLVNLIAVEVDELTVVPSSSEVFQFDVGITTTQGAIAETGTLVLDSARERNRLVSLVPPAHIAIVDSSQIYATLGEALAALQGTDRVVSPAVTFITGPSRTADIELTLTIGVHGPQELYVIINEGEPLTRGS